MSFVVWTCSSLVVCSAGVLCADWVVCAFGKVDVSGLLSVVVCFNFVLLLGGHWHKSVSKAPSEQIIAPHRGFSSKLNGLLKVSRQKKYNVLLNALGMKFTEISPGTYNTIYRCNRDGSLDKLNTSLLL